MRLLVLSLGLAIGVPVSRQSPDQATADQPKLSLEEHIAKVIGPDTVDCGTHSLAAADPIPLINSLLCARDMSDLHKPFQMIQRGPGEDSEIARGFVGRADGSVWYFEYDSAPCGGPGCAERFVTTSCPWGHIVVEHDRDRPQVYFGCSSVPLRPGR